MKSLPLKGLLSFDSYLGYINLSLPADASANLTLSANKGNVFTDLPLKIKNNVSF